MSIGDVISVSLLLIGHCKFDPTPHAAEIPRLRKNRRLLKHSYDFQSVF